MRALAVDVLLDPTTAIVMRRQRRRGPARRAPQRFRGEDAASALEAALRRAALLRTLRRIDLRILLDTPDVVVRLRHGTAGAPDGTPFHDAGARVSDDLLAPPVLVPLPDHVDGAVLEVALARTFMVQVRDLLARRRFIGPVRMDLAVLSRTRTTLARLGPEVRSRPGVLIDVTRTTLGIVLIDAAVRGVRCVPARDLRAGLRSVAAAPLRDLAARPVERSGRGWVHIDAPPELRDGVRAACRELLPPSARLDLARTAGAVS